MALAPYWAGRAELRLFAELFAYLALASLWNLLAGYAGLASIGQQAFVGLGAYLLFGLAMLAGVAPLMAIPLAGLIAGVVAVPIALLIFRLKGAYFAIGTWVVAEVFRLLASQVSVLGGGSGISLPVGIVTSIASGREMREFTLYWLSLFLVACVIMAIFLLLRSRYGLALTSLRDNEVAARSNGVDVWRIKLMVYCFCACGTAMLGALIFLQKLRVSPDTAFSANDWTAFIIFIVVIGGIGTIEGPIVGTIIFFALRQTFSDLGSVYLLMLGDRGHRHHDTRAARLVGIGRSPVWLEAVSARPPRSIYNLARQQIGKQHVQEAGQDHHHLCRNRRHSYPDDVGRIALHAG